MNNYASYIDINSEVIRALQFGLPVVALETGFIKNCSNPVSGCNSAIEVHNIIRENGAVPAMMAIIDGRIKIGLTKEDLEGLCRIDDVMKIKRKDIPYAVALEKTGVCAFSTAMVFAEIAGIKVFASEKVSGSVDIQELPRTNVCVICSQVTGHVGTSEAIEQLSILGVPVYNYSNDASSDKYTVDSPIKCAKIMKTKWDLNIDGSIVVTNTSEALSSIKENSTLAAQIAIEYNKISCD